MKQLIIKKVQFIYIDVWGVVRSKIASFESKSAIIDKLEQDHCVLLKSTVKYKFNLNNKVLKAKDIVHFTQQFYTLVKTRASIIQAISLIRDSTSNITLKALLIDIVSKLENGMSLAEALAYYSQYFDRMYIGLIQTGESTGNMEMVLSQIVTFYNNKTKLLKSIKKALLYPIIILITAIVVVFALLVFIIPQFQAIFSSFDASLPWFTQCLIDISNFCQYYGGVLFVVIIFLMLLGYLLYKRVAKFNQRCFLLMLSVPVLGALVQAFYESLLLATLSSSLNNKLSIVDSFKNMLTVVSVQHYRNKIESVLSQLNDGVAFDHALKEEKLLSPDSIELLSAAEHTQSLADIVAQLYSNTFDHLDHRISQLTVLIEPFFIIFLSLILGAIILGMYLPIFKLGSVIH